VHFENLSSLCQGVHVNLGSRIAEERRDHKLSQQALAELCGVSREIWGRYERGLAMPGSEVLVHAAAAGIDVLYVLTGRRDVTRHASGAVDRPRLQSAIESVEEGLTEAKRKLAVQKKTELILAAYDLLGEGQPRDNIIRLVRLAA
jgi:transcriptional regulator with XRE-family HTH domain